MKNSDHLNDDNKFTCDDCNQRDGIGHAIVDHYSNTVRVVCNDCFNDKYLNRLYGKTE
jgi:transcription elongation factor Elf1